MTEFTRKLINERVGVKEEQKVKARWVLAFKKTVSQEEEQREEVGLPSAPRLYASFIRS